MEAQFMKDSIKLTMEITPKQVLLHCETNILPWKKESETIANNMMNLAKT